MITPADRDQALHQLYQNRELLIFVRGQKWFDEQVDHIHWDWEQSGTPLEVSDLDITIARVAFEVDNGY